MILWDVVEVIKEIFIEKQEIIMILYNGDIFEFVLWDIVEKMRYFWYCILRHQWCNEMFMMLDLEISVISFWRDDGDIIAEIAGVLFFIFKIFF